MIDTLSTFHKIFRAPSHIYWLLGQHAVISQALRSHIIFILSFVSWLLKTGEQCARLLVQARHQVGDL